MATIGIAALATGTSLLTVNWELVLLETAIVALLCPALETVTVT